MCKAHSPSKRQRGKGRPTTSRNGPDQKKPQDSGSCAKKKKKRPEGRQTLQREEDHMGYAGMQARQKIHEKKNKKRIHKAQYFHRVLGS